jgi:hypothetical protein
MNYETALQWGVDLIFPAVFLFTLGYAFLPFWRTTLGWAMFLHGSSTLLLLLPSVLQQLGVIGEEYPFQRTTTGAVVVMWIFAWWLLAHAVNLPHLYRIRDWFRARREARKGVR